jgi:hypothetical protein
MTAPRNKRRKKSLIVRSCSDTGEFGIVERQKLMLIERLIRRLISNSFKVRPANSVGTGSQPYNGTHSISFRARPR